MLIDAATLSTFNGAISKELYASHLYKHVANHLQRLGLFGGQKFFLHESEEELKHYQKIVDFINDLGGVGSVGAVPLMDGVLIGSIYDALRVAKQAEEELLQFYVDAYEKADPICEQILLEFIKIQRQAVGEYGDFMAHYSRIDMNKDIEMDKFLAQQ